MSGSRAAGPSRLARVLQLRPGEGTPVALAVSSSFVASTGLMIGGSAIEALFFSRAGADRLPVMYLILGGTMLIASITIAALLARLGRVTTCIVVPLALAALAAAGRVGLATDAGWIESALWLLQGAAQFVLFFAVWSLAGIVTDTRQAKRFFPLIGAGGVLGLVLGGFATKPLAAWIGAPNLILVWVATLVMVAALGAAIGSFARRAPGASSRMSARGGSGPGGSGGRPLAQLREGFRYVARSSLLRWLALTSVLFSLLFFSLYLPFSAAATERYPDPEQLAGFFGVFFALSTGVAFVLSLFVTNRLLARFGVPSVMLVLPVLYLVAFGVLAVQAGFTTLLVFRFAQVAWLSGGASSTSEAVINTVPVDRRDQTRAFLYGGPTQVGTVLAGVIALIGERALSPAALFGIGAACAALATYAMVQVRRAYPKELVQALREGRPHVFDAAPAAQAPFGPVRTDPAALEAATGGLADPEPGVRRVAAHVLGDLEAPAVHAALLAALHDADPDVRATAIDSLARSGVGATAPAEEATLDALRQVLRDPAPAPRARAAALLLGHGGIGQGEDGDGDGGDRDAEAVLVEMAQAPDVEARVEALRVVGGLRGAPWPGVVRARIRDPEVEVRARALRALAAVEPAGAVAVLVEALADERPVIREAAADGLGVIGAPALAPVITSLSSPARRRGALAALEHLPVESVTDEIRRLASELVARAVATHDLGAAIDGDGDERRRLLKDSLLDRAEREAVDGLRAAALLRGRGAMTVALESVRVTDPGQRANALEVIESVGERDIVRPLLRMWEAAPARTDQRTVLAQLAHDPDAWIRACAQLVAAPDDRTDDPGGRPMTESLTTLPVMERVLFLRRVSLFAELAPPDLQPIAEIAEEHTFADGDVIAEQGAAGEEMYVIVRGEVAVVADGGGGTREVAVRSTGDVVGEMAIVAGQPRMAGLVARGDVRVLSIGRRQFEAILRERPETALGVIRVLCQRLAEPPA